MVGKFNSFNTSFTEPYGHAYGRKRLGRSLPPKFPYPIPFYVLPSSRIKHSLSALLNLTSLLHLDISSNDLSSLSVISQAQWPHLTYLDLSFNYIEGVIPRSIGNLTKLTVPPSFGRLLSLTDLQLHDNQLSGSIPPSISNLSSLTTLYLYENQLSGSIPPSISNLSSLTTLYLFDNQLSGSIPPSLSNLSSLKYLKLGRNQLNGSIPQSFRQLSSLVGLDLSQNQLNESLHASFRLPSALRYLHLSFNNLQGHISFALFPLTLTSVDLSYSNLTFNATFLSPPAFRLEVLRLPACNIVGEFPAVISTQFNLVDLDLSTSRIAGNVPSWLWRLPVLRMVNMSYNLLTGRLPPTLTIRSIDLSHNYLEGPLPTSFPWGWWQINLSHNLFNGSIPSQIVMNASEYDSMLVISNNYLSGGIPSSICENGFGMVQIMDLSSNKLSGIVQPNLGSCSNLVKLNLANNSLNGQIPEQLGSLGQLRTLRMEGNNLSGSLPFSLQNCESLEIMDLSHNKLNDTIPTWIAHLSKLRVLILKSNAFWGRIPSEITRLHDLQVLDLSCNYLTGGLPPNFTNLHAMKRRSQNTYHPLTGTSMMGADWWRLNQTLDINEDEANVTNKGQELYYVEELLYLLIGIDLSSNSLSGNIPEEIGLLKGLIFLNMSRNQFKGKIPNSIGNISELESLDLSQNQLIGEIPIQLQALTFLESLDVSHNRLTGRIPEGGQLLTFNAVSFEANQDLCGLQLNKSCENKNNLNSTLNEKKWTKRAGLRFHGGTWELVSALDFRFRWFGL